MQVQGSHLEHGVCRSQTKDRPLRVAVNGVFAYTRPTSLSEVGNADAVFLKFRGEQMARSHRVQG